MQNYHTANSEPLTAILAVIRGADPQRGVTARQIATTTGLNLVHIVIPALKGYVRSDILRYVPSGDMEIHVAMADGTRSLVDTSDPAELVTHLVDEGLIAERPPCENCHGTGSTYFYAMGMRYKSKCLYCGGTGREV